LWANRSRAEGRPQSYSVNKSKKPQVSTRKGAQPYAEVRGFNYLLLSQWKYAIFPVGNPQNHHETRKGCVARHVGLTVLKTLDLLGRLQGYGIARRIEKISVDPLSVGLLTAALHRLENQDSGF
jgi:hypothetical protein